ncbi:ThuA domain-containing protein [Wenxinia saemankumensis]|uniref:Trehalose utilization protein n=1 Tax=Wenxinia saemankumensis TaxID=1447782 RepID=A0A1M6FQ24_9RHOB|nr:ThuA domain-containing protein [Wenxinia saemankumensis]SHI99821.1 Trehalose utilization protein [Wenxinia saemankumensis]
MTIRATVWNEYHHEQTNRTVADIYPDGIHGTIAAALQAAGIEAATATLPEPEHGLTEERLAQTDVLLWWGHARHGDVDDAIAQRVAEAVWAGMGLIVLHSGHFSKPFKKLMGTPCNLTWREAGERERIWLTAPNHPIAAGVPNPFVLENEEMYGEPFGIPEPEQTVFVSWFQGGEVFRSGACWTRGAGKVFYFRPGHETYPTYHDANVLKVIANAVEWAYNPAARIADPNAAPNVPVESAPEKIERRGKGLHAEGEEGFR